MHTRNQYNHTPRYAQTSSNLKTIRTASCGEEFIILHCRKGEVVEFLGPNGAGKIDNNEADMWVCSTNERTNIIDSQRATPHTKENKKINRIPTRDSTALHRNDGRRIPVVLCGHQIYPIRPMQLDMEFFNPVVSKHMQPNKCIHFQRYGNNGLQACASLIHQPQTAYP